MYKFYNRFLFDIFYSPYLIRFITIQNVFKLVILIIIISLTIYFIKNYIMKLQYYEKFIVTSSTNPSSTNPKITNLHDSYKRLDKITRHGLLNQKDFIGTSNIYNPYIYYDASKNKSEEENNDDNIGKFNFDDYFV